MVSATRCPPRSLYSGEAQTMEPEINKHILFVDDEANVRAVVKVCLESLAEWQVSLASSGREGLAIAETKQPDAILLDVMMPEMDGVTFLKHLRSTPQIHPIPVVLLTAKASFIDPQVYSSLGAQGAISKPFDPLLLASQISEALGWHLTS
jgi:CheY-like chemotaxis protein